jgi:hypothetical protein
LLGGSFICLSDVFSFCFWLFASAHMHLLSIWFECVFGFVCFCLFVFVHV